MIPNDFDLRPMRDNILLYLYQFQLKDGQEGFETLHDFDQQHMKDNELLH